VEKQVNELTVKIVANMFLQVIKQKYEKEQIKLSSYSKYLGDIGRYIIDSDISNIYVNELCQADIESFIESKMELKSNRYRISLLKRILSKYRQDLDFTVNRKREKYMPKVIHSNEYMIFFEYLIQEIDLQKLGILIALLTGLRIGEVCGLKWCDIDFTNRVIYIRRTVQRIKNPELDTEKKTVVIVDTPKTADSERIIPLQAILLDILVKFKSRKEFYIVTGKKNCTEPRTLENWIKKHLELAGVNDINFHALRHTFATRCIEKEVDPKTLSELLGHADVSFTFSRYVHPSMEQKRKDLEKLVS
jgi:integrase